MGCGTSRTVKSERSSSTSQVTIESHQRTVAAYRRQRIARDMEQTAYLRAEAEVEKALMLKRCSVDERRPSYIQRVLEDLAEVEEGQEETEEEHNPVITIDSASEVNLKRGYTHEDLSRDLMYSTTDHASSEDEVRDRKLSVPVQDDVEILTENHHISEGALYNDEKLGQQSCTNHISEESVRDENLDTITEYQDISERNITLDSTDHENAMKNNLVASNEASSSSDLNNDQLNNELEQVGGNVQVKNENRINENLEQKVQGRAELALGGSLTPPAVNNELDSNTTNSLNDVIELEATHTQDIDSVDQAGTSEEPTQSMENEDRTLATDIIEASTTSGDKDDKIYRQQFNCMIDN